MYIYIYIYVGICVCVCFWKSTGDVDGDKECIWSQKRTGKTCERQWHLIQKERETKFPVILFLPFFHISSFSSMENRRKRVDRSMQMFSFVCFFFIWFLFPEPTLKLINAFHPTKKTHISFRSTCLFIHFFSQMVKSVTLKLHNMYMDQLWSPKKINNFSKSDKNAVIKTLWLSIVVMTMI